MFTEFVVSYLSPDSKLTYESERRAEPKPLVQVRSEVLRGCNVGLSAFGRDVLTLVLKVDFSKGDASSELNGLFANMGARRMVDFKNIEAVDSVLVCCSVH